MKKLLFVCCFFISIHIVVSPCLSLAMDRYDLLSQARVFSTQGKKLEALNVYTEYISTHPTVTGKKSANYKKNSQFYLKNILIAFSNMIEIQESLGQQQDVKNNILRLKSIQQDNFFGSKNLYSLGKIYKEYGETSEAIICFNKIVYDQIQSYQQSNNKVFIRSCIDLLEIYRTSNQVEKTASVITAITKSLALFNDFDLKDRYQIGKILLDNGDSEAGKNVLNAIIRDVNVEKFAEEEVAVVNTLVKLLKLNSSNHEETDRLLSKIDEFSKVQELSSGSQYSIGIACLNSGQQNRGIYYLENVKNRFPNTNYARKSLFVLGRVSASSSDWDKAIQYYAEYVDSYPEPRFFSLKAYSRLIDCYWAKYKNPNLIDAEVRHLADITNDIADFETQLNLARDLKDKGYDGLAEATFDLGISDAQIRLKTDLNYEERLRILWILQKYSFPMEKFSKVEEFARESLRLVNDPVNTRQNSSEKALFFKSQTYIWLAQVYQKTKRAEDARKVYSDFLAEFQGSKDADYVRFSLAEIYEEKGEQSHAMNLYQEIGEGVWKVRASKKLSGQGRVQ